MALTIRITQEEKRQLEKIRNLEKISTSSGAIKHMIKHYENLLIYNSQLKKENDKYFMELKEIKDHLRIYIKSKEQLETLI